jgi:hypothetical protein
MAERARKTAAARGYADVERDAVELLGRVG